MKELDFETDKGWLVEYVADKIQLAEVGDERAIQYIEFMWDYDPEVLEEAQDYLRAVEQYINEAAIWID